MASHYVSRAAQQAEDALRDVQERQEGNRYCADCGVSRPEYINLTIGTFICEICADFHRTSSNRRVKDMFAGDITAEEARRLESVGNEVANRKFLAVWDSREFPEPDRRDKDALREFLWLKYEGIFKKTSMSTPQPPASQDPPPRPYYDNRGYEPAPDRSRRERPIRREQELFRGPQQHSERPKTYWNSRYGDAGSSRTTQQPMIPPHEQRLPREDHFRQTAYPDRYRAAAAPQRFQPPQPAPLVPYGVSRSMRPRYRDEAYEEYASNNSSRDRDRRYSDRNAAKQNSQDSNSEEEVQEERRPRKKKGPKGSSRVERRKSSSVDSDYGDDRGEGGEKSEERRSKKTSKKSKKKGTKDIRSRRSQEVAENGTYEDEIYSSEEEEATKKSRKKPSKRGNRDLDSVRSSDGTGAQAGPSTPVKSEFDLMSEWMGDLKDSSGQQKGNPDPNGAQATQNIPLAMQQAYQTAQMPMMSPMAMYGSVMPMPGGGFMPVMTPHGMMPPMGMPGIPGMHGMPPMPPGMVGGMPPMSGPPNMPPGAGVHGMPGLINGMHNLNMGVRPQAPGTMQNPAPPPPPPMGMPAGPPPGPPPEPL